MYGIVRLGSRVYKDAQDPSALCASVTRFWNCFVDRMQGNLHSWLVLSEVVPLLTPSECICVGSVTECGGRGEAVLLQQA